MLAVHVRVSDAADARPTPVRLAVTAPDGTFLPPLGRAADFPVGRGEAVGGQVRVGRDRWVYVDGGCEIPLPAGVPLRFRAAKGPEYTPLDRTLELGPGQLTVRLDVARWSDVRAAGWLPGDVRAHFLSPHAAALEAAAEDLSVVDLLAAEYRLPAQDGTAYPTVPNLLAFSGGAPAVDAHGVAVAVNTFHAHPVLGKVGLLGTHRPVFPLAFGEPDATDDGSVCDLCDQGRRKGGLAVWADPFAPSAPVPGGEALVALLLGKVDAVEWDGRPRAPLLPWYYRLLSAGFATPLVGGSGKGSNRTPLGYPRTYVNLDGRPPTYPNWLAAIRAGRCFVTNGPLVAFEVGGRGPGEAVDVPAGGGPLRVAATAASGEPFDRLDVVADGQVAATASATPADGRWRAALDFEHAATESGWLAARAVGGAGGLLAPDQSAFAHTAPVYVRVGGASLPRRRAYLPLLRQAVERTRQWVADHGRFADPKAKRHLLALCDRAAAELTPKGLGSG